MIKIVDSYEGQLEHLLAAGARLDDDDCCRDGWDADVARLVARARRVAARQPRRAVGHYVAARICWLAVDAEFDRPRPLSLTLVHRALRLGKDFLPAVALARDIADFFAMFEPAGRMVAESAAHARTLAAHAGGHPGVTALLATEIERERFQDPYGAALWWSCEEKRLYYDWETTVLLAQRWDGVDLAALAPGRCPTLPRVPLDPAARVTQ